MAEYRSATNHEGQEQGLLDDEDQRHGAAKTTACPNLNDRPTSGNADHEQGNGEPATEGLGPVTAAEGRPEADAVAAHMGGEDVGKDEIADRVDAAGDGPAMATATRPLLRWASRAGAAPVICDQCAGIDQRRLISLIAVAVTRATAALTASRAPIDATAGVWGRTA